MIDRRQVITQAAAAFVLCRSGAALAAQTAAADIPDLDLVHPDLREFARLIAADDRKPLNMATLAEHRSGMTQFGRPFRTDVPVEKRMIPGAPGQPDVAIYVINAAAGKARPALLGMHGGGFVAGNAEVDVADLQDLCMELGTVAISVDYRLAPEAKWSASLEDNYAALKWLHANAASIGADKARIALLGGSAGGGHAALLAIAARDRGEVPVAFQCLIYPMLDDRTGSSRPVSAHVGKLIWTASDNRFGWKAFLGQDAGLARAPKGAVPARRADLAGLPPAFIAVGSLDLFHDEDVDYARRLNSAGVGCELVVVPGAFHGFDLAGRFEPGNRLAAWFNALKLHALRQGLGLS